MGIPVVKSTHVVTIIGNDGAPVLQPRKMRAQDTLYALLGSLNGAHMAHPERAPFHLIITREDSEPTARVTRDELARLEGS